ncbi:alpha-amylase family glycosyl hydrolase [bacterium]|nr:alpha-amylase family glycosyl hydrolase [bacterium]
MKGTNGHQRESGNRLSENRREWHRLAPNYERRHFQIPADLKSRLSQKLTALYGSEQAKKAYPELERILKVHYAHKCEQLIALEKQFKTSERLNERHAIFITYGDLLVSPGEKPLETLSDLCRNYLKGVFNTLHILPFFPYSSDRGFAVMDFEEVDPDIGSWEDILQLKTNFQLMFDGVFNHVSLQSRWFQEYLNGNPDFQDFFTEFSTRAKISEDHLKLIVRPRTSDLLTPVSTMNGQRLIWTTFSPDQVDLNYQNPKVLLKMVEILLTYVRRGADFVRLDAVTYLWKQLGTSCVHLNQSHTTIQLFRDVLDAVAPYVGLVTETNVPHQDNVRYFGNGHDEAQMIYNFALPPLVLHTFQTGNANALTKWAKNLKKVSEEATYLNILDSHDGIGVMAVRDILTKEEIEMMALRVVEHGGFISYKANGNGTDSPYELNITWYSALNREDTNEATEFQVKRYLASRAIALAFMGVPGIYLHGLLGSKNDSEAVLVESERRSINRKSILKEELVRSLHDKTTSTAMIFHRLVRMIQIRVSERAFHPNAAQRIVDTSDSLFVVLRSLEDENRHVLAATNVTDKKQTAAIDVRFIQLSARPWRDLLSGQEFKVSEGKIKIELRPYDVFWLRADAI